LLLGQDISESELDRYRQVRQNLIEQGYLQEGAVPVASESSDEVPVVYDAWYTNRNLSVTTQNSRATDFRPDGTRFYILGRTTQNVVEYHLSSAWDIESASYVRELDISGEMGTAVEQDIASHGLFIRKDDGEMMWILNRTEIWEYTLSTPWDISTAAPTGYRDLSDFLVRGHDIDFKPDGSELYVDDRLFSSIFQFEVQTPWDIETISFRAALDISGQQQEVRGIELSPEGDRMFLMDTGRREILEYVLSTAFDVTTATYIGAYGVGSESIEPRAVTFRPDKSKFYVTETAGNIVYQYKISRVDPNQSSVTASADKVIANNSATSRVSVIARDSDGDRIIGREISLSSNSSTISINNVNNITNSSGLARFDVRNSTEETVIFTAESPNSTINETVAIHFVGIDTGESTVVSNREKVVANGEANSRIIVTARDKDGDELEGVRIELRSNSNHTIIENINRDTDHNGEAVFSVKSDVPETVVISAEGMGKTIDQTTTVSFVTVNAIESSISKSNEKILANGIETSQISVTARDLDGDLLEGVPILINHNSETVSVSSVNSTTDADGIARFVVSNTNIETVTFSASGLGVKLNQTVDVRFTGVDADESSMISSHEKVQANGTAFSTILVTARDQDRTELSGVEISIMADSENANIESIREITDSDGVATFRVRNIIAESVTYVAQGMGVNINQTVTVNFVTVDSELSSVAVSQNRVEANGIASSDISVVAQDEDGDPLEGVIIRLEAEDGTSTIEEVDNVTNSEGKAIFKVRSDIPGRVTFVATAIREGGNVEINERGIVEFIPVAPVALSAYDVSSNKFTANWELVDGASGYLLDVSSDSSFNTFFIENENVGFTTNFQVSGVDPGTIYYYRVRAEVDEIIGANSSSIAVVTYPEIPNVQNAENRGITRFTARWQSALGARRYQLDVAQDSAFTEFVPGYENVDVGNQLSYEVTGLYPGTTYYYRIRSQAFTRISPSSQIVEATTAQVGVEQSEVAASQLRVLANGQQENQITVILRDADGNTLGDEEISLEAESGSSHIEAVQSQTDENGRAVFAVTNQTAEQVRYRALVAGGFEVGTVTVEFIRSEGRLELGDNYPNPFMDQTILPVTIPHRMHVKIEIINVLGSVVQTVMNEELETGYYEIGVDGSGLASGVYFYRMMTDEKVEIKKMLLVR